MRRRITATLLRSTGPKRDREVVWVRRFAWMDTAVPRTVQLALYASVPGDIVEFASVELGFQIGIMHIGPKNEIDIEYSPLVRSSQGLMKLMGVPA